MNCFFVSDLHGDEDRYRKLLGAVRKEVPTAVFLGGDFLPSGMGLFSNYSDFLEEYIAIEFSKLKKEMGEQYPKLFMIMGNDDPRVEEERVRHLENSGIWSYVHQRTLQFRGFTIIGYACVPPTPFMLKDWERYDVSRYVDPGTVSPERGYRTVDVPTNQKKYRTIAEDIEFLTANEDMTRAVCLFHSPPYRTNLDRVALDDVRVDHVPLDVHVGSIAIQRFIEQSQPLLTLHGHIHESTRIMGNWRDKIGRTHLFGGAHDGPELAIVRFDPGDLENATRELI